VAVHPDPGGDRLGVVVEDDGGGLPAGFDPVTAGGLGLQIVRTLVEGELGGTLALESASPGTRVRLDLPSTPPPR
jgi:two-component sensor histidine kinase